MTLKELLGDAFHDGMTAEEISAALADKDFVPKTENAVAASAPVSDLAAAKARLKGEPLPTVNPSDTDNTALERLDALERENRLMKLKDSFIKGGYDSETAERLASASADGFSESENRSIESFRQRRVASPVGRDRRLRRQRGLGRGSGGNRSCKSTRQCRGTA